ncbi:MAG: hypothetical protein A2V88_08335 [Elusimicrobia bacterium RBG_16_66_12]|nr:MAG: hypothetical protein A2V88_08335 [Elusimicrobia bacterium RBG_16_66_12]
MVLGGLRGTDLGIRRSCAGKPPSSLHNEGRAWDWAPQSPARAWDFLRCATEGEAELARRAGIYEAIYERKIWTSDARKWRPYAGPDPHVSHVHVGFSRAGAAAQTSLYAILESGQPTTDASLEPTRTTGAVRLAATAAALAASVAALALEKL